MKKMNLKQMVKSNKKAEAGLGGRGTQEMTERKGEREEK